MMLNTQLNKLTVLLILLGGVYAGAQAQPQTNGMTLGETKATESVSATQTTTNTQPTQATTTGTAPEGTAPTEVTTMDPMDPARDAQKGSDATRDNRAMAPAPVSGTVVPDSSTAPRY